MRSFAIDDPAYPAPLRTLPRPPAAVCIEGPLPALQVRVAVFGSRTPTHDALAFARTLASAVTQSGGVVVSGLGYGIEAAAQRGAVGAGAPSLVVHATGSDHLFPADQTDLARELREAGSGFLWPFPPRTRALRSNFRARNGVVVALADVVVIVQAGVDSGSRNAARWARQLGRPLWVVPPAPWAIEGFEGSLEELNRGALPLLSPGQFLVALGLTPGTASRERSVRRENNNENMVLSCLGSRPVHVDQIVEQTGLTTGEVATALLTLSMEDVLVEASAGCFRLPVKHPAT
jgi:DNA processing protein